MATAAPRTLGNKPDIAAPSVIGRPRLEDRLDEAFGKRLTLVVAGAGFGKSTLLTEWARDLESISYTLTSQDASVAHLRRGLAAAIRTRLPEVAAELVEPQGSGTATDDIAGADAFAGQLCDLLAHELRHDVVLVLDDVHELGDARGAARLLEALCRQAPPTVHLVLGSRASPLFPIERLRGQGQVLEIDADALGFNLEEVAQLLQGSLDQDAAELASDVHRVTGGWPAAVRLTIEALRGTSKNEREAMLSRLGRPGSTLFSYLAGEVFAGAAPAVRELLRATAEFDPVTPSLCEALGLDRAAEATDLLSRGGFLARDTPDGEEFRLHALVREFARETWPLAEEERRTLHRRAAHWFESRGLLVEAARSIGVAGDPRLTATFLRRSGRELLPRHAAEIIALFGLLRQRARAPELEHLLGDAYAGVGDYTQARMHFERAARDADKLDPELALSLGRTYYTAGDLGEAVRHLGRARIDGTAPAAEARALALWSNAHSKRGDYGEAQTLAMRALGSAKESREDQALAHGHHAVALAAQVRGERRVAHEHFRLALDVAERANDIEVVARAHNNLGADMLGSGEASDARVHVEGALGIAELHGLEGLVPVALNNRADIALQLGRFDEALSVFARALEVFDSQGAAFPAAPIVGRAQAYQERGDIALSRAAWERCRSLAEVSADIIQLRVALVGLAQTLVRDDPSEARRLVDQARALDAGMHDGPTLLGYGWVLLALGEQDEASRAAMDAERIGREVDNRSLIAHGLELRAFSLPDPGEGKTLLEEAVSIWRDLDNPFKATRTELALARVSDGATARASAAAAERRLRSLGVNVDAAARAAGLYAALPPRERPAVEIRTLGGFGVLRRGEPVTATEWQSKKARDLLKLLISRRGRPAARDKVMEALWAGEDPAKLSNRLSVALSTLRSVLDPTHSLPAEHFIRADAASISLDLEHAAVDVEMFLTAAGAGLAGKPDELEDAESLYAGDFLEEDLYEDWAAPLREESRATYVQVARALARRSLEALDLAQAARYLRRILESDPYDEQAHLDLVAGLASSGEHGEARRAYQMYVSRMEEISVEPTSYPERSRI